MVFYQLLAHEAEFHHEQTNTAEHIITEPIGFTLAVIGSIALVFILGRIFKWHLSTTLLSILALLLGFGIYGYSFVPELAAILIAVGIALALGFVLIGIANEQHR